MGLILLLLGPTFMILLGLQVMDSVPLTFIMFYGWLLVVPLIDLMYIKKKSIAQLPTEFDLTIERKSLLIGLSTGVVFLVTIVGGITWLHRYFFDSTYVKKLLQAWGFSGEFVLGLILVLIIINPFLEEVYWRSFMFKKIRLKHNVSYTILITASFYSLYHILTIYPMFKWPLNIIGVIPVFIAGLIWGYIRSEYNSLSGIILSHTLADTGIILVYFKYLA